LGWDEACALLVPLMRGVHAAHRAGVVHRDLKPDNLFLARTESGVVPKVLDFGVAAMKGGASEGLHSLTRSGTMIGTPSYMPLEQLTGGEVDERSDVYALGVVLYEMLTGVLPFVARSASELAVLQATGKPASLSIHAAGLRACEPVVAKALAREPGERYASVDEFADKLASLTVSTASEMTKTSRRSLWLALLLALLVVAGGVTIAFRRERGEESSPATTPVPALRSDARSTESKIAPADGAGVPPPESAHDAVEGARSELPAEADSRDDRKIEGPSPASAREVAEPRPSSVPRKKPQKAANDGQPPPRPPTDIDFEDF
jgi:serine/threonine-protein kinase